MNQDPKKKGQTWLAPSLASDSRSGGRFRPLPAAPILSRGRFSKEDCLEISTRWLEVGGYFKVFPQSWGVMAWPESLDYVTVHVIPGPLSPEGPGPCIWLSYPIIDDTTKEKRQARAGVDLTYQKRRPYFKCPLCQRRVACIYLPPNQRAWGCRFCYTLRYLKGRHWRSLAVTALNQNVGDVCERIRHPRTARDRRLAMMAVGYIHAAYTASQWGAYSPFSHIGARSTVPSHVRSAGLHGLPLISPPTPGKPPDKEEEVVNMFPNLRSVGPKGPTWSDLAAKHQARHPRPA